MDNDGDGLCDLLDPCPDGVSIESTKIALTKVDNPLSPAPSFSKLAFKGLTQPLSAGQCAEARFPGGFGTSFSASCTDRPMSIKCK